LVIVVDSISFQLPIAQLPISGHCRAQRTLFPVARAHTKALRVLGHAADVALVVEGQRELGALGDVEGGADEQVELAVGVEHVCEGAVGLAGAADEAAQTAYLGRVHADLVLVKVV